MNKPRDINDEQAAIIMKMKEKALVKGARNVLTTTHIGLIRKAIGAYVTQQVISKALNVSGATVHKYATARSEVMSVKRERKRHLKRYATRRAQDRVGISAAAEAQHA